MTFSVSTAGNTLAHQVSQDRRGDTASTGHHVRKLNDRLHDMMKAEGMDRQTEIAIHSDLKEAFRAMRGTQPSKQEAFGAISKVFEDHGVDFDAMRRGTGPGEPDGDLAQLVDAATQTALTDGKVDEAVNVLLGVDVSV